MFEAFQQHFTADPGLAPESAIVESGNPSLDALIARFGGVSFNRGVYRIVRASDLDLWHARVSVAFPDIGPRLTCFGYDWLGRVFAVDPQRMEAGHAGVALLEPGSGDIYDVPCNLETFHGQELIADADGALASGSHETWLAQGGAAPGFAECIGYRVPLFLGGADEFENFELSDLDVYWNLMGQLLAKTRDLPEGTKIRL